jgi:hypothetical protein
MRGVPEMASVEEMSYCKAGYFPMAGPITVSFRNRLNVKDLAIIDAIASGSDVPAPADHARGAPFVQGLLLSKSSSLK